MVGHRTVGCCSHVATLIFVLSYSRHFDFDLKGSKPANFLNSILVKIGSDSEYSDDNLEELNQIEKGETIESKSKPNAMKNSLSFATTQTVKNAPKKKSIPINPPIIRTLCSYRDFSKRIPSWGGNINVNVNDFNEHDYQVFRHFQYKKITNTCTIDYPLFGLWYSRKLTENVYSLNVKNELNNQIDKLIRLIDNEEWDRAKTIWILKYMRLSTHEINEFTVYGGVYDSFIKHLSSLQQHVFLCDCEPLIERRITDLSFFLFDGQLSFSFHDNFCGKCLSEFNSMRYFKTTPLWLFIEIDDTNGPITIKEIPHCLNIAQLEYKFLFTIFHEFNEKKPNLNHFRAIFKHDENLYLIDDLAKKRIIKEVPIVNLSWVFYYLA